ncbi:hypothetical protein A3A76_05570 [Candidatus Woesebacteria bacterium RIFCSPLOWO2_01_FULL_39_23]|uniref:DUF3048 domain-containing protein n=1 Tax=Candidatus Woesebacteria bacterium RIFCSPHIGHO2_01_FULL_40_22 TaxID=1802499 RepID=A0A1F7YKU9_9BACT|nr:MAG: hypothetical protein A2141_03740 [Candidatus Woesebacteria bacterium RBG_16_40_11]OGM27923.1 MAG: hypothetical protein A2628_03495 [Candidatus Woesebacteria bacterium RIFCSPHIGHO2_01_FULL_40_22]OGM37527.1 MAG: hypothetical protein A3E41_01720 [Candidatus Woesebacteria bacterium RIFCSPHIGHO2_12_FULL_38_9]OGM61679.1 MAG: hypothetical protein A3A76_05570 [Candidatus Woesebacteria bacterium RIFCSPLOWO2_01_FULL_39_23]
MQVKSKSLLVLVSFLGLYLLATGVSWALFSYLREEPSVGNIKTTQEGRAKIDQGLPKTEECPINGAKYSKPEKAIWETRRPVAAMIENHADSRPPSGISKADIVYEAVAEGGITRFLSIFYCGASAEDVKIAPVRSARIYFIDWASEYGKNPIFMHVGGANDFGGTGATAKDARALESLQKIGWRVAGGNDFDTTFDSGYPVFWRNYERLDHAVATEHTMMASLDAAYTQAEKRGFGYKDTDGNTWSEDFTAWKFGDDRAVTEDTTDEIAFGFWDNKPDYDVSWKYDQGTNSYLRSNGGKSHIDLTTQKQLSAKNVVIQFVKEKGPIDANMHMFYTTTGNGNALIFQNGDVVEGSWEKKTTTNRTRFLDASGKEINFVRGSIWIEAVPTGNKISY